MNIEEARDNMIEQQVRTWDVLDQRVLDAMHDVPRELFTPDAFRALAFSDTQIPLAHDQCMMSPKVEGRMLQALDLRPSDEVLEIGTGTGFTCALFAHLCRSVHSVDIFPDFVETAGGRLRELGFDNIGLEAADVMKDYATDSRFDVIAFTGALTALPPWCGPLLKPHGRVFAVLGAGAVMSASIMVPGPTGRPQVDTLFETWLPHLLGAEPVPAFEF